MAQLELTAYRPRPPKRRRQFAHQVRSELIERYSKNLPTGIIDHDTVKDGIENQKVADMQTAQHYSVKENVTLSAEIAKPDKYISVTSWSLRKFQPPLFGIIPVPLKCQGNLGSLDCSTGVRRESQMVNLS